MYKDKHWLISDYSQVCSRLLLVFLTAQVPKHAMFSLYVRLLFTWVSFITEIWLWLFKSSRKELCFCIKQSPWMTACSKSCVAKLQCEFSKPAVVWFCLAKLVSAFKRRMVLFFSRQTLGPWLSSLSSCAKNGPLRKIFTLKYLHVHSYRGRQHASLLLCCKNSMVESSNTTSPLFHLGLEKGKRIVIVLSSRAPRWSWGKSRPGLDNLDATSLLQRALTLSSAETSQSRAFGPEDVSLLVVIHEESRHWLQNSQSSGKLG